MLNELIERVSAAKGPDRNLDAMIHHWALDGVGVGYAADCPKYSDSIDAALALCERMLPGWRWGVASHSIKDGVYSEGPYIGKPKHVDGFRAHVTKPSPLRPMPHIADARTAPLAILLALLRSLNQEESRD